MPKKPIKETIHAKGIDIGIYTSDFENEYISLTDIAKYKSDEPNDVINCIIQSLNPPNSTGLGSRQDNWNLNREVAKLNYRIHTDAIKENLLPPELTPEQISYTLIEQGKPQSERLVMLREPAVRQMQTMASLNPSALPRLPEQTKQSESEE